MPTLAKFENVPGAQAIVAHLVAIANIANTLHVGIYDQWKNKITDKVVEVWNTFHGDPSRISEGIPSTTLKKTTVDNVYLEFIRQVLNIPSSELIGVTYEETIHEYANENTFTASPIFLVAIPSITTINKLSPIIITYDWDVSLIDSTEFKPLYRVYNLIEGSKSVYNMLINMLCTMILYRYDYDAILTFAGYVNMGAGNVTLSKWASENGAVLNATFIEQIRTIRERTGLIDHVMNRIHSQLFSKIDNKTMVTAMISGVPSSDVQAYNEMQNIQKRFNALKTKCINNPSKLLKFAEVSTTQIFYDLKGPVGIITNVTSALNEEGETSHISTGTQTAVAESILKKATLLKRTLSWPTGNAVGSATSSATIQYNRIQVPTTNWDDLKQIYNNCPKTIYQKSKSYSFHADTLHEAVIDFYASIKKLGTKSASMSYDGVKSTGTYDVSYSYAT